MNVNWSKTAMCMTNLPSQELHKLVRMARRELASRWQEREAFKERLSGGYRAMANLMAGVAWAMACRQALRASKGHEPACGKRAQSGEMWLPRELLTCVRSQVKARGWHPITAASWLEFKDRLEGEERLASAATRAPTDAIYTVQFAVPKARGEARRIVSNRFDYGGES